MIDKQILDFHRKINQFLYYTSSSTSLYPNLLILDLDQEFHTVLLDTRNGSRHGSKLMVDEKIIINNFSYSNDQLDNINDDFIKKFSRLTPVMRKNLIIALDYDKMKHYEFITEDDQINYNKLFSFCNGITERWTDKMMITPALNTVKHTDDYQYLRYNVNSLLKNVINSLVLIKFKDMPTYEKYENIIKPYNLTRLGRQLNIFDIPHIMTIDHDGRPFIFLDYQSMVRDGFFKYGTLNLNDPFGKEVKS